MHEYYTPKPMKFQGFLAILTLFVNYADFYVNRVMSTCATTSKLPFIIFNYFAISRGLVLVASLNIVFASFLANMQCRQLYFACIAFLYKLTIVFFSFSAFIASGLPCGKHSGNDSPTHNHKTRYRNALIHSIKEQCGNTKKHEKVTQGCSQTYNHPFALYLHSRYC